jgi:transcriptional regulator with XRE-family HTH domain
MEKMIGLEYIVKEFQMEYKAVAKSLGISPQTMQDWLKKRRKIPAKRIEQLSNMFNLPESFFQKELIFTEKGEVTIRYLESIAIEEEIPVSTDEGEIIHYYKKGTYEDEIQFLKETMEKKKKQNDIRQSFEGLMKYDTLLNIDESYSDGEIKEPLLSDSSNTETFHKITNVMKDENISNAFKVMVHLLNMNDELGGKPILTISPEYRAFAGDFLELLKKHKIKNKG